MKKLKRGLTALLAAAMVMGVCPTVSQAALINTSDNEWVYTNKTPSGKTGRNMTISFMIQNDSGSDISNLRVRLSEVDVGQLEDGDNLEDGFVYPFEVDASTFSWKSFGSLKSGAKKSVSLTARVRRDLPEGYYGVPIDVYDGDHGLSGREYVNVWISKAADTGTDDTASDSVTFALGEGQSTPDGVYPNVMNYTINMRNASGVTAYDVNVKMVLDADTNKFPFEINDANYDRNFDRIEPEGVVELPYSMAIRSDAYSGYYPIGLKITYKESSEASEAKTVEESYYVRIKNKDKEQTFENAEDRSKARLIVDSYETIPAKIYAGDQFELVLRMKNASSDITATNILFAMESEQAEDKSAVFSTDSGSSSVVVNSLRPGETTELRMQMTAKASVDQRSYTISVKETYDSPEYKNASETVSISIPVYQTARLNTGTFEVMPESIEVGGESNVMFSINNMGKVILYNVMVDFTADSINPVNTYVGNIEPGKTGNVDVMLSGVAATMDEGKIKIKITYEDENGDQAEPVEKELNLFVSEPMVDMGDDMDFGNTDDMMTEEPSFFGKHKGLIIGGALIVLAAGGGAAFQIRKKKKKASEEELDLDEDEFDPEDETGFDPEDEAEFDPEDKESGTEPEKTLAQPERTQETEEEEEGQDHEI